MEQYGITVMMTVIQGQIYDYDDDDDDDDDDEDYDCHKKKKKKGRIEGKTVKLMLSMNNIMVNCGVPKLIT
jgi:hypothetical protein